MSTSFLAAAARRTADASDPRTTIASSPPPPSPGSVPLDPFSPRWLTRNALGDVQNSLICQVDLEMMIEAGDVQPNDRVSYDGGRTWVPLHEARHHFVSTSVASSLAPTPQQQLFSPPPVSPRASQVVIGAPQALSSMDLFDGAIGAPPAGAWSHANRDASGEWSVSIEELATEFDAMAQCIRDVMAEAGMPAVFPDVRRVAIYGHDLQDPSTLGGRLLEKAAEAINACAHIRARPHLKRPTNVVFWNYLASAGFWAGREKPEAFESFDAKAVAHALLAWDPASSSSSDAVVRDGRWSNSGRPEQSHVAPANKSFRSCLWQVRCVAHFILLHISRAETLSWEGSEQEQRLVELKEERFEPTCERIRACGAKPIELQDHAANVFPVL